MQRILGRDRDERQMFEHALALSQAEAAARPDDGFAWFNVGTNLVALGRTGEAVEAYDRARTLRLPWRMLWYQFGPFEAYLAEGRLADVQALADANLVQSKDLEESHYFRGRALQAKGQVEAARGAYQAALRPTRASPRRATPSPLWLEPAASLRLRGGAFPRCSRDGACPAAPPRARAAAPRVVAQPEGTIARCCSA